MNQMHMMNGDRTLIIKKNALTVIAVVLGHLGSLWAVSLMKAPELPTIKKDPITVRFVQLQAPPKSEPKVEPVKSEPKPKPIEKPVVKPEPIKPVEKVEKIQVVKQADTPKKIQAQAPVVEEVPKALPVVETTPVVESTPVVETAPIPKPVQAMAPAQPVSMVKNVEIGGNGVQWLREPRISIDESELRGTARVVLLMIEANQKGEITAVNVIESSGVASLDARVMRAVRSAKLKPYMENGTAYSVKAKQSFYFN